MRDGEPCFIGQGQNQLDYQNSAGTNNCTEGIVNLINHNKYVAQDVGF